MYPSPANVPDPSYAVRQLVDDFVSQQRYLPPGAHPLASPDELPPRLQFLARVGGPRSTWRAWTDNGRSWFVAAQLCRPNRAPAGVLALEVVFFDPDGRAVAAGVWVLRPNGSWALHRVIDTSDRVCLAGATVLRASH